MIAQIVIDHLRCLEYIVTPNRQLHDDIYDVNCSIIMAFYDDRVSLSFLWIRIDPLEAHTIYYSDPQLVELVARAVENIERRSCQ